LFKKDGQPNTIKKYSNQCIKSNISQVHIHVLRQGEESMIILLIIISLIMMGMSFAIYTQQARASNMTGCIDQASVDLDSSTCSQTRPFLLPFP